MMSNPTRAQILARLDADVKLRSAAPALLTLAYQYASECRDCDGLGAIEGDDNQWRDCDGCADIRAVITGAVA